MQAVSAIQQKESGKSFLNPGAILDQVGIGSGDHIADFGCGSGYFVLPAARKVGTEGRAYGVDVLKAALSSLKTKARIFGLANVVPIWANVEVAGATRDIPEHSLDMVLLVQILFQSTDHEAILTEVKRVIKPQARILVVDWNDRKMLYFGPALDKRLGRDYIESLFTKHGFKLEKQIDADAYHYGLIFHTA